MFKLSDRMGAYQRKFWIVGYICQLQENPLISFWGRLPKDILWLVYQMDLWYIIKLVALFPGYVLAVDNNFRWGLPLWLIYEKEKYLY